MILEDATWPDIEAYLRSARGIVIPIGSTEQHGPGGAIGTDAICAEAIARGMPRDGDILVGPTIALGVAQFNLGFPGTVSLRATTLMAVVTDYVASLAAQGFRDFYILNGHGGNIAPCQAAFQDIHLATSLLPAEMVRDGGLRLKLRSWWEYPRANALRQTLYGAREGIHATPSEIAISQAARPWTRRVTAMPPAEILTPDALREMGGDRHRDAHHHRARFPDGRIGSDPALATPDDGARLLAAAIADARDDYQAFLARD
jgi:creatinine amidohydrolase